MEAKIKLFVSVKYVLAETEMFQKKLDETTVLLRELQDVQRDRLSTKPPPNTVCLLAPSTKELQIGKFYWSLRLNWQYVLKSLNYPVPTLCMLLVLPVLCAKHRQGVGRAGSDVKDL